MTFNTIGKGSDHRAVNGGSDAYYTNESLAFRYAHKAAEVLRRFEISEVMEPSAGSGVFVRAATEAFPALRVTGYDIAPNHANVIRSDFFDLSVPENALVIGNPPFGFSANLAIRFFNHAAIGAKAIAFVVPRTFQKGGTQDKLNRRFWLIHEEHCPSNSFILDGQAYDVPCVFQIWVKRGKTAQREDCLPSVVNPYIEFTTQDKATFSLRRVGGRAGEVLLGADYNKNTTYFCREKKKGARKALIACYDAICELRDHTAGVRSVSKREIHAVLAAYYKGKKA